MYIYANQHLVHGELLHLGLQPLDLLLGVIQGVLPVDQARILGAKFPLQNICAVSSMPVLFLEHGW
jgi:hypothetical protein